MLLSREWTAWNLLQITRYYEWENREIKASGKKYKCLDQGLNSSIFIHVSLSGSKHQRRRVQIKPCHICLQATEPQQTKKNSKAAKMRQKSLQDLLNCVCAFVLDPGSHTQYTEAKDWKWLTWENRGMIQRLIELLPCNSSGEENKVVLIQPRESYTHTHTHKNRGNVKANEFLMMLNHPCNEEIWQHAVLTQTFSEQIRALKYICLIYD